jgi:modulator of FtsH protease
MSMYETETEARTPVLAREDTRTIFAQVMFLVAATAGVAALGAYVGRHLSFGWGIAFWIAAFACIIGINAARARGAVQLYLLFGLGAALGLAIGPTINHYVTAFGPTIVAQAAGMTALFIAGFGAVGYATRRDLSVLYRGLFFALLALIVFGIVMIFVSIPGGALIYCVLGLVIFAGYTLVDFNRLKRAEEADVPRIAAGIFLDVFNVFLFMLQLLGLSRD